MIASKQENMSLVRKLTAFQNSLAKGCSKKYCLRLWGKFIRARDGYRCVDCHSCQKISAHHICRKSLVSGAQFDTGNGITLCHACHKEAHRGFNGKPDLLLPIDAQNGEKLATMERLYSILTDDAVERGLDPDTFYFLSDNLLSSFKKMQGFASTTFFPGARIEQAYLILAECELGVRRAMAEESGVPMLEEPLLPGGLFLGQSDASGGEARSVIIRNYVPRSKPSILRSDYEA